MSTAVTLTDLDTLAGFVNESHKLIQEHQRSILLEARAAGDALIEAKKLCKHGEFKPWVEKNTLVKYAMAARYMQVARQWDEKSTAVDVSNLALMSIRAFLGIEDKKQASQTKENVFRRPTNGTWDLNRALKLAPLAHRGVGGEKDVAIQKLTSLYQRTDLERLVVQAFTENMKRCSQEDLIAILADIAEEKF